MMGCPGVIVPELVAVYEGSGNWEDDERVVSRGRVGGGGWWMGVEVSYMAYVDP